MGTGEDSDRRTVSECRRVEGRLGWNTLKHPKGIRIPANTPIGLAWKSSGGKVQVAYFEDRSEPSDFQPVAAGETRQDLIDLTFGEDDRSVLAAFGTNGVNEPEVSSQNFLVEKQTGCEGLVLGSRCDVLGDSQIGKEFSDFWFSVALKILVIEVSYETADPTQVGDFG